MSEILWSCIGLTLLASIATECEAEDLQKVPSFKCMHRVEDYSFMWWAYGFRDERRVRCYQTGRYGLAVDTENVQILHLGTIANAESAEHVLTQSNDLVFSLPPAELNLSITIAGKTYRCIKSVSKKPNIDGVRLVESGYFFQRGDIWGLEFQDDDGNSLLADARFEVAVWPDYLAISLYVCPIADEGWEDVTPKIELETSDEAFSHTKTYDNLKPYEEAHVYITMQPKSNGEGWEKPAGSSALIVSANTGGKTCPVKYEPSLGWFEIDVNNAKPDDLNRDSLERIRVRLHNPEESEKTFRLMFNKDRKGGGLNGSAEVSPVTGLSAILCDENGKPLGIPVQISKNWHASEGRIPYQGVWLHGLTMLTVPPMSQVEFELRIAYAHWGGVAAASHGQLCLIGWGSNQLWNEAAIGAWGESLCFEPDQAQVGNAVLDTRPLMVHAMNNDKPVKWSWTNNVGGADFLLYHNAANEKQWHSRMRTLYRRYCPNLTEVTYAGRTQDSKIDLQYTVSLYRCDDIMRGVYRFRYDVREPVDFSRLVFFQCGGQHYNHAGERKYAMGDATGLIKEWDTQWGGNAYKTELMELPGPASWLSMHEAVSQDESKSGAWANKGIIIRDWKARLGGKSVNPWAAERGVVIHGQNTSLFEILPPEDLKQLQPGDFVEAEVIHVVMPQFARDYYGPNENLRAALQKDENTWRMIHREAAGNNLRVEANSGRVLREYPILIEVDAEQSAKFTVTGGIGYVPVTFSGLNSHDGWELVRLDSGEEHVVDQSLHGNDFWQTNYDPVSQEWSRTYNVLLDTPDDRVLTASFVFRHCLVQDIGSP